MAMQLEDKFHCAQYSLRSTRKRSSQISKSTEENLRGEGAVLKYIY